MERLIKTFKPEKYVLDLEIDKSAKRIGGIVTITGEVFDEVVKFHAVDLQILSVMVNGKKTKFKADGMVLTIFDVKSGMAEIVVEYTGYLKENMQGAYLSTYEYNGDTEVIVATQFESHYAREAFLCIDEPEAKAVFELSLTIDGDAGDIVLANTPVKNIDKVSVRKGSIFDNNGNISVKKLDKYVFEPTPRMSTYLLAWVIGRFHGKSVVNKNGVKITTYAALNQSESAVDFANEVAAKSLEFYDDNFGVEYPLKKLDQVALPDFEAGAMENWGLVTYRESMLLVTEAATLSTRKSVALTVAHELSHQWFGDLVTMKWWDDLWLNESFASVMEYYAVDSIYPEFKIWEGFFTGDCLAALRRDATMGVQSVHQDVNDPGEIATLFDPAIVYAKGARLMLMMIRLMGWEDFCKGIRDYFEKYQYKNTVGDDLWGALNKYAEFDTNKLMHAFIDRPGYPVVTNAGRDFEKFTQKRFLLSGKMQESDWPLPEITEDMSGHYILNLSESEFETRLREFDTLSLEEKLRLLIDRDLLAKTSLASSAQLLPLLSKFKNENSAAVWNIILTIVSGLKIFFEHGTEDEKRFKKYVLELTQTKLKEIGLITRKDDDENTLRLRAILLALDFYAENTENMRELAAMYSNKHEELDAEIRTDILDAKLFLEPDYMDEYLDGYIKTADPEIKFDLLLAMTLMKDKNKLLEVMKLLNQLEIVKPQDQFHLFLYLYRNPEIRKEVFAWLTENWEQVKKISGDKSLDNYPRYMASSIRTEDEYKKYCEFYSPLEKMPALGRAIEMGKNEILARLKLISSDKEAVIKKLRELVD